MYQDINLDNFTKNPHRKSQDGCEETFAEHGSYKADCKGVADETWSRTLSHKFETEPERYLEEKLLNALMEQLLVGFRLIA